jgi:hypothetical protein
MVVYKFLCKKLGLDNVINHRIKISEYRDMNDPFELHGAVLSDANLQSQLTRLFQTIGVLCFSRNWKNPVLWSHYADKHKGICLGFEIKDTVELEEVRYVESPEQIDADNVLVAAAGIETPEADAAYTGSGRVQFIQPPPSVADNPRFRVVGKMVKARLLTKFEAWRYEDEVRLFLDLREDQRRGDLYFADFDENIQLSQIILGPRCSITSSEIEAAVSIYPVPITVVQATLSPNAFEVIEDSRRHS